MTQHFNFNDQFETISINGGNRRIPQLTYLKEADFKYLKPGFGISLTEFNISRIFKNKNLRTLERFNQK